MVERDDVSREGVANEKDESDTETFLWRPRASFGSGSSATGEREIVGVVNPVGIESTRSRFVSSSNPCFAVDSVGDSGRGSKVGEYRLIVLDETGLRLGFGEAGGVGAGDSGRGSNDGESCPSSWLLSVGFCDLPAPSNTIIWGGFDERPNLSCLSNEGEIISESC